MGKELDIDDVSAGHPIAAAELLRLRAELSETHRLACDDFDLRSTQRDERDTMRSEIERLRGCMLWLLWGHQGGSSPVGQPIRRALGIDTHASMTPEQIEAGQRFGVGA